jgi:hypothetical protein
MSMPVLRTTVPAYPCQLEYQHICASIEYQRILASIVPRPFDGGRKPVHAVQWCSSSRLYADVLGWMGSHFSTRFGLWHKSIVTHVGHDQLLMFCEQEGLATQQWVNRRGWRTDTIGTLAGQRFDPTYRHILAALTD